MSRKRTQVSQYYVIAAVVAAELNHTLTYCKQINLTASNAQAASSRVGNAALGFKALTGFIDDLASYTMKAATDINTLAHSASKLATDTARAATALKHFEKAKRNATQAKYAASMEPAVTKTANLYAQLQKSFQGLITQMELQLHELKRNLRTANILASICRIEACRVDIANQATFNDVANRVDSVANQIRQRVDNAIALFDTSPSSEAA
ncbi:chemotaxis protein [Shewanella eurypsychrophilus]|uniref:Chemotaxis protein n=1 Tax=Shewanella eurypsychrophilus TaxID=2593656 RepID=A0ABX6V724_9GAMM|nr:MULTISPECIES: chemotaxis protein [Shewanella]QFU22365.1 chemotaxis protein [Shewanella sp. YLB-09]QPG57652.1 chemotaxis protein [Shewanella eurypsychrophilus]